MAAPPNPPLRLLVVDDSAYNRRSISEIFASSPEVQVVAKAADGEEALRLVSVYKPDVITLDLEMPKMDGFTFLRILMSKIPTPVIVVSSYSQKENVFKALELGAMDFVAKPDRYRDADMLGIRHELLQKVMMARAMRPALHASRRAAEAPATQNLERPRQDAAVVSPRYLVAIASSTGGPTALMDVFSKLPPKGRFSVLIAQHMPEKFTRTFAERLGRRSPLRVSEAADMDVIGEATGFVCPGRKCMQVEGRVGGQLRIRVVNPDLTDRYIPSADRLFSSVAMAAGSRAIGVILTGMGDDGVLGAKYILEAGGTVLAESELTAVVYGMPGSAVRAGVVSRSLPLTEIADAIVALTARGD